MGDPCAAGSIVGIACGSLPLLSCATSRANCAWSRSSRDLSVAGRRTRCGAACGTFLESSCSAGAAGVTTDGRFALRTGGVLGWACSIDAAVTWETLSGLPCGTIARASMANSTLNTKACKINDTIVDQASALRRRSSEPEITTSYSSTTPLRNAGYRPVTAARKGRRPCRTYEASFASATAT